MIRMWEEMSKRYWISSKDKVYEVVDSTVRSYLSWLKDNGKVDATFQDSMLL